MCGIIAVLRERDDRPALMTFDVVDPLDRAAERLRSADPGRDDLGALLAGVAEELSAVDAALRSMPGVRLLVDDAAARARIAATAAAAGATLAELESKLDADAATSATAPQLESVNAGVIAVKDAVWAIARDRVVNAEAIAELVPGRPVPGAVASLWSIQVALAAVDRLEVRGRDSAGLQIFVTGHGLDIGGDLAADPRFADPLLRSGTVREVGDSLVFVYKAAAEIGELGDNTAALRAEIRGDDLLQRALAGDDAHAVVLGHTRWASVGIISEPNAHPLDSWEVDAVDRPYVSAVLNGDVDNFADLKTEHSLSIAPEITTDAKVIPTLVSRGLGDGDGPMSAFRTAVASFEGSVAIAAHTAVAPNALLLALRGSGQALYVGLAEGAFVVASEPYGVVEECDGYLRMDGETPADRDDPVGSQGQLIVLDGNRAGTVAGIDRHSYDGSGLAVTDSEIVRPEITTRDIDRGEHPHFLLKEIGEAPDSFRKTLRGKVAEGPDGLEVRLGPAVMPDEVRERLRRGEFREVVAIGQGTAAIAARAVPAFLGPLLDARSLRVRAVLATELSGFELAEDMSDVLVVAVSQSGTTTDTNRTVDLVRSRGATVVSIVNRRGSDLTDKSDGVLYTSDGRDVEMSVASTKAFYAQVAAAALLSVAIAEAMGSSRPHGELLRALRRVPDAMRQVLASRPAIAQAARHAPGRRYWAIVGNGVNRIASSEVRIKLSELCYKAIPEDSIEDKKHIDLSSEPMILVCAAGLQGSTADDVAKEVAIYRAHKALPVVIASDGDARFSAASELLTVPAVHPDVDFLLATMVGHLFGYEAALAIDAQALPLREIRAAVEGTVADGVITDERFADLRDRLRSPAGRFLDSLRTGAYDGHLEASTASRVTACLRYALGMVTLESYQAEMGKIGTPAVVLEDLTAGLNRAVDELTRPVDAIKHQAKTVTVGISRSDETLVQSELVRFALDAGAARDRLSYRALRTLAALNAAVSEALGYTRYRIEGDVDGDATIQVIDRGGIARDIPSRTDANPVLRGSKHRAAFEREVTVARGGADGRTVIHVPEVKDGQTVGLMLLHCRFHEHLPADVMRSVLMGYRGRYGALKDAVTESEPSFRDDLLDDVEVVSLLTDPVYVLAQHWTS